MRKIGKYAVNIDLFIACAALVALVFVTFSNVILRYFFNAPYQWGEEVQMILIVWLIWFGGSCAFRTGDQICVDMVLGLLPKKIQSIVNIVIYILSVAVLLFMFKQGVSYVMQLAATHRVTETLHVPRAFIYSCMPISCFLMIGNLTYATMKDIRREKEEGADENE